MKIAYDAKRAFLNSSGLGNYSRTIIKAMAHYYSSVQQFLFTPTGNSTGFYLEVKDAERLDIIMPTTFFKSFWRSYKITHELNKLGVDVYHGLSNELPVNIKQFKGKKIVTIHDLIFLRYPHLYPFIDRQIYRRKFYKACVNADVVIAISEETKKDIIHYFNIPEQKIKVIYQSCDDVFYNSFSQKEIEAVKKNHQLPAKYLLYVGTIEERKNLATIIKALKHIKDIPLVVVGKKTAYFKVVEQEIVKHNLQQRVLFLNNVTNNELPMVYQLASVFIYPSIFEGFGIPILEALVSNTPVMTNKNGCFPEAGGPNSIYIDPLNDIEMAQKINEVLNNESLHKKITENGFVYAEKFHKAVTTKQLMEIYTTK